MSGPAIATITGDALVQLAKTRLGQKYILGAQVPKDNPNWNGPWDCAEFASWVFFQITHQLYGCNNDHANPAIADAFTGYWRRDAESIGAIISLDQAARTPGAFVLRFPQPGATGHIVLSDGKGGTVEAHSSADGVVRLKLAGRRWDTGILPPGVVYTQNAALPTPVAPVVYRLTHPTMTGPAVSKIQQALLAKGFDSGTPDGEYGPHTAAAVRAFQMTAGLTPDGEVGSVSAKALGIKL